MSVKALAENIGKHAQVHITGQSGIAFGVRIIDTRLTYGALQCLCEPLQGTGAKWYAAASLMLTEKGGQ